MEMQHVQSSNIQAVGYDDATFELHVQFKGSGTYIYHGVSRATYDEFIASESKGSFLARNIKGVYPATKKEEKE